MVSAALGEDAVPPGFLLPALQIVGRLRARKNGKVGACQERGIYRNGLLPPAHVLDDGGKVGAAVAFLGEGFVDLGGLSAEGRVRMH